MRDSLKPKHGVQADSSTAKRPVVPAPRPTPWAAIYAVLFVGVPLIAGLGLLDLVLYLVFRYALDRCYGIGCFL